MARNHATRETINQTLRDLDNTHQYVRTRRTNHTTRYSKVSVNTSNVTPIKRQAQKDVTAKNQKNSASFGENASKITSKVKTGALANVYYLKSAFSQESEKKSTPRSNNSKANSNRNRKIKVITVSYDPKKRAKILALVLIITLIAVSIKLIP